MQRWQLEPQTEKSNKKATERFWLSVSFFPAVEIVGGSGHKDRRNEHREIDGKRKCKTEASYKSFRELK